MKLTPLLRASGLTSIMILLRMALLAVLFANSVEAAPRLLPLQAPESDGAKEEQITLQEEECRQEGGTPETHYELDVDFSIISSQVYCEGGGYDGVLCDNGPDFSECYRPDSFIQPTASVLPDQRPDTAAPVENPGQSVPNVDDREAPPGGVAENPPGGDETIATRTVADQVEACETLGGTATVTDDRATAIATVRCDGGVLDGMSCINGHYDTFCSSYSSPYDSEQDPRVPPTGGVAEDPTGTAPSEITFVQVESMAELEDALLAEDPDGGETVVIYNQVGDPVFTGTTWAQLCSAFGGSPTVNEPRTVGGGLEGVTVVCTGGLLDRKVCAHDVG